MRSALAAALLTVVLSAMAAGPQEQTAASRMLSKSRVVSARIVDLKPQVPEHCLSVEFERVTVVLDDDELRSLAAGRRLVWLDEDERMVRIHAGRARELLRKAGERRVSSGCRSMAQRDLSDASYLVGRFLDAGQATVFRTHSGAIIPTIQVEWVEIPAFTGWTEYFAGADLFWILQRWIR